MPNPIRMTMSMRLERPSVAVRVIGSNSRCVKADIIPQHLPSADLGPYMRTHIETTAVAVGGSGDVRTHITTTGPHSKRKTIQESLEITPPLPIGHTDPP